MTTRSLAASLAAVLAVPALGQVPDLYDPDTVRDVWLTFSQANYWTLLLNNYQSETNIAADMRVDNVVYPNVGVRFRGNTSYTMLPPGSQKKSFNIELDWMVQGQDIHGYTSLNLNNGFHDPTFLREFLTYWIMRRHGVAPKANFVRLWLNNSYWGVYINVEQPDKDMMKQWFRSNDGNRYRCFPTSGSFNNGRCAYTWLGSTLSAYLSAYQAKQGDGSDLMQMCNVLNNTGAAQLQAALPAVFSVDAFYRYAAVMNVTTNTDSYLQSGKDHFLYIDEVHGDGTTFPFDCNEALAGSSTLDPWYMTTNTYRPAFTRTLQFADWRQRYKAHLRAVIDQSFNPTYLNPIINRYYNLIAADVAADPKKLYSTAQFQQNLNSAVTISAGPVPSTIPGLLPFVQSRYTFLNAHADLSPNRAALSNLAHAPANPNPTQTVTVTVTASSLAAAVQLFYRARGPFRATPMFDDGAHGDGAASDGVFGAQLPAQLPGTIIDYYVEATTATGLATYLPHTAELEIGCGHFTTGWPTASSPIRINEFVAQNVNGIVDEQGQHEDWVELYNTSGQPVVLDGMRLSDDLTQLKWTVPTGTTIAPYGTVLVWCDEDGTQGPMHANFKLSSSGELVALWDEAGQNLLDQVGFGAQTADVATGRVLDGGAIWVTLPLPTPNARNELLACGSRGFRPLLAGQSGVTLALGGAPQVGTTPPLQASGGGAGDFALLAAAFAPGYLDLQPFGFGSEVLLLDPFGSAVLAVLQLDGTGAASLPLRVPNDPGLAGLHLDLQLLTITTSGFDTSNGLELAVCP